MASSGLTNSHSYRQLRAERPSKWRREIFPRERLYKKTNCLPLEDPHIVLVSASTAKLFGRSNAAPAVLQFISKGDCHLTVPTLDSPCRHQRVPVPAQRGHDPAPSVRRGDFATI